MSNVNINNLARLLQELLQENIEDLARATNFIRRRRVLSGFSFFLTMMINGLGFRPLTLFELQQELQEHGLEITESGLCQRFTQSCVDFLKAVLGYLCQKLMTLDVSPEVLPLTSRFPHIYVDDCTEVSIPSDLADDFPSCGSGHSVASGKKTASVKAFCRIDVLRGTITVLSFGAGKSADIKLQAQVPDDLEEGSLHLCDRGFFDLKRLRYEMERNIFFISRIPTGTIVMIENQELADFLKNQRDDQFDEEATLGKDEQLPARLVGIRLDTTAAAEQRRKLNQKTKKNGRQPSERQLALCDWAFYATNLSAEEFDVEEITSLYRIRWQIELLFKLWKSEGHLDQSHGRHGLRVLGEFYATLSGLILTNWFMLMRCGRLGGVSHVKMFRAIQKAIPALTQALWSGEERELVKIIKEITQMIKKIPKQKKRKKKTTRQLLQKRKSNQPPQKKAEILT